MKKNKNSNNWEKAKNKINQKKYSLPDGWDSRDVVAEQLKCDPSKVSEILSFGIDSGDILCKQFYVWDQVRGRTVNKTFYKENFNHDENNAKCVCQSSSLEKNIFNGELNGPVKRVYSRHRKIEGTLYQDKTVTWDNGKISSPSASSWKKRDIYIIS